MAERIEILASTEINKEKWNHCISTNDNGLIYSTTDYLDAMAENWHGIVINDYETVMAIPWKKKFGIRYAYTPPFIQQLGLCGDLGNIDLKSVLSVINAFVSFADIHFNYSNRTIQNHVLVSSRTNLIINLAEGFDTIRSKYKDDLQETIKKTEAQNLRCTSADIDEALSNYHQFYGKRMPHTKKDDYDSFLQLCQRFQITGQCLTKSVCNEYGESFTTALFLKDNKRIYNIINATPVKGREKKANHFLLDRVISEFSGQPLIFDFEGSELPGVQAFYKKFGAVDQPYFHYRYNGLPWPLRLLKR